MRRGLFAGFGKATAVKLEALKLSPDPACRADAAWGLALWYRSLGDYGRVLDNLAMQRLTQPSAQFDPVHLVFEIEALLELGREIEAEAVIKNGIARLGTIPQLCLSAANAAALKSGLSQSERNRLRLDWLNKPLVAAGFAKLEMKDKRRPLAFDNFKTASTPPHPRSNEAKISLLMPAYNVENTIGVAIESLLKQTWTNIELLIRRRRQQRRHLVRHQLHCRARPAHRRVAARAEPWRLCGKEHRARACERRLRHHQ